MRLEKRWYDFWIRCPNVNQEQILDVRSDIWKRYQESHRSYHNLEHIEFCLSEFDRHRDLAQNPMVVEMAIWFHDVVYYSTCADNEQRSAQFANTRLRGLGATRSYIKAVRECIMATKHFPPIKITEEKPKFDERLICDIDLAGLGQDWHIVDTHNKAIRSEYIWVAERDYKAGRCAIMRRFLDRDHIFYLPAFRDRYEKKARSNIRRIIKELEAA